MFHTLARRVSLFAVFFLGVVSLYAQPPLKLAAGSGTTYYMGDLTDGFNNSLFLPNGSFTAGLYLTPNFMVRGEFAYSTIGAADSLVSDPGRRSRNLSFRSPVTELNVSFVWQFIRDNGLGKSWNAGRHFSPYVFIGIGGYYFNPQAQLDGTWYDLQPLGTEGQFLAGNGEPQPYPRVQFNFPMGIGLDYRFAPKWGVQLEVAYRRTVTDYLDDVSTDYPNLENLRASQGPVAAALSDPSGQNLFLTNATRGNPTEDDHFVAAFVRLVYYVDMSGPDCWGRGR